MAQTDTISNTALLPIQDADRVFTGYSHASLWFSLGVGLLVIQVGAYLVPALGTQEAMMAIVVGSLLGAGLLAWVAKIGCDTGLTSAGLIHQVYGSGFAKLPIVLNIVQLVGWTAFELVIMRDGTLAMLEHHWAWSGNFAWVVTLVWGGILMLLMASSMLGLVRGFVSKWGLPLVVMSLAWLSWQFLSVLSTQDVGAFWHKSGDHSMGFLSAIDLVMAMPVSWLPLVADYARHGQNSRTTVKATWAAYALANIWCYALGVLVVSVSAPDMDMVNTLLLAQGGLLALGLILVDELDNAYGDVYSASLNSLSLWGEWSLKTWGMLIAGVCTALAIVLPMHSLEPFLLMLSSVFIPLYGVILGRMGSQPTAPQATPFHLLPALLWLLGIGVFHVCGQFAPEWGSAIPSLAFTLAMSWLTKPAKKLA